MDISSESRIEVNRAFHHFGGRLFRMCNPKIVNIRQYWE